MKSLSFRASIASEIHDALQGLGGTWLPLITPLAEIGSMLAAYSEEGQALAPSVFVTESTAELVGRTGGGEIVRLGTEKAESGAAAVILKRTAPLARGGWHIFIEKLPEEQIGYGIFSGSSDPSVLTSEESIFGGGGEDYPALMIRQIASNKVLLRRSSGSNVTFLFNADAAEKELEPGTHIAMLCEAAARRIDATVTRDEFELFLRNIVTSALARSHGALLAVVNGERHQLDGRLRDFVRIDPPISLARRFQEHRDEPSAITLSNLQMAAELLSGVVGSDGLTILSDDGRIIGFRCLVDTEGVQGPARGGSRTRAFAALESALGEQLVAAYFQSQDGRTDCVREEQR